MLEVSTRDDVLVRRTDTGCSSCVLRLSLSSAASCAAATSSGRTTVVFIQTRDQLSAALRRVPNISVKRGRAVCELCVDASNGMCVYMYIRRYVYVHIHVGLYD